MSDRNLQKMEKNIIRKETRVKIGYFTIAKGIDVEQEINKCLQNEKADNVRILVTDKTEHIIVKYNRYQQYKLTDNGYVATGIFHHKECYDAYLAHGVILL